MRTWRPDQSFYQLLTAHGHGSPGRTARLWRLAEPIGLVVYQKVGLGMRRAGQPGYRVGRGRALHDGTAHPPEVTSWPRSTGLDASWSSRGMAGCRIWRSWMSTRGCVSRPRSARHRPSSPRSVAMPARFGCSLPSWRSEPCYPGTRSTCRTTRSSVTGHTRRRSRARVCPPVCLLRRRRMARGHGGRDGSWRDGWGDRPGRRLHARRARAGHDGAVRAVLGVAASRGRLTVIKGGLRGGGSRRGGSRTDPPLL